MTRYENKSLVQVRSSPNLARPKPRSSISIIDFDIFLLLFPREKFRVLYPVVIPSTPPRVERNSASIYRRWTFINMAGDSRRLGEWGNWIPRARARRWKVSRRTPEPGREKARLGLKPSSKRAGGISNQVGAFMRLSRLSSPFHNSLARSLARPLGGKLRVRRFIVGPARSTA